jgi:plastocyanin
MRGIVVLAALALAGCGGGSSPAKAPSVEAADFRFAPAETRVKAGQTVEWRNTGATDHTVKGPGFFSRAMSPGATFRHRFDRPGTYPYLCTLHPQAMRGRVVVGG